MTTGRIVLLFGGCFVLGVGVALLLLPALGSDGYSMLVSGVSISSGLPFVVANLAVGACFLGFAWLRGLPPGLGTVVQVVVVGITVNVGLAVIPEPAGLLGRWLMLGVAFPVLALGIALYLGSRLGAGPAEAPSLACDPPVPFAWSYSVVQGGGALLGWQLGAAIGPGTFAVIFLLGPVVALAGRVLRLDLHQPGRTTRETRHPEG